MIKLSTLSSIAVLGFFAAACGTSAPPPAESTRAAENAVASQKECGPPGVSDAGMATCEPGCKLVLDKCRADKGVIVPQSP